MNSSDPADRGRHPGLYEAARGTRVPFAGYCLVTGVVATAAGAAASLLGGELAARLVLWGLVLVLVAAAAGLWWAWAPASARRWTVDLLVRPAARAAPTQTPLRKS